MGMLLIIKACVGGSYPVRPRYKSVVAIPSHSDFRMVGRGSGEMPLQSRGVLAEYKNLLI